MLLTQILGGLSARSPAERLVVSARHEPESGSEADVCERVRGLLMNDRRAHALALLADAFGETASTPDPWYLRGVILLDLGCHRDAVRAFGKAVSLGASGADCHRRFALALQASGLVVEARNAMDVALARDPESYFVQYGAGAIARECGDFVKARSHFEHALRLSPGDVQSIIGRAASAIDGGDVEAGLAWAREGLERYPDEIGLWEALAIACNKLGRPHESYEALAQTVAIVERARAAGGAGPATKAFLNLAIQLMELGRHGEAARTLADELRRAPSGETSFHLALRLLCLGRYLDGWSLYTARWNIDPYRGRRVCADIPRWDGQPLEGRTILLGEEQGIGDVIQFARYASVLAVRGARVLLGVRPALREMAARFRGVDQVVAAGDALPACDFFLNLAALPHALRIEVGDDPVDVPYLGADPVRRARWREVVGESREMRVGIVWAGSPTHVRDADRTMTFAQLEPVLKVSGVRFFSLQKGPSVEQLRQSPLAPRVTDLDPSIEDFADTVAILAELDLLITVDTSVAHAAGAIGRPVWMLVSEPAEFRWLTGREDSIWYPTMRLFRQSTYRDWTGAVGHVAAALVEAREGLARGDALALPVRGTTDPGLEPVDLRGVPRSVEAHDGVFQIPDDDAVEGRSLAYYGEFLPVFCVVARQLAGAGASVVEIGAGIGAHTLGLARAVGSEGDVFAIERDARRGAYLAENVQGNRFGNITLLRGGLGLEGEFPTIDSLHFAKLDGLVLHGAHATRETLAGCEASLWRTRPWVLAEVDGSASIDPLASVLDGMGYRLWRFEAPLFAAANFARREDDVFGGRSHFALLAIPEERDVTIAIAGLVPLATGVAL